MGTGRTPKDPPREESLDEWFDLREQPSKKDEDDPKDASTRVTPVTVDSPPGEHPPAKEEPARDEPPDLWDWEFDLGPSSEPPPAPGVRPSAPAPAPKDPHLKTTRPVPDAVRAQVTPSDPDVMFVDQGADAEARNVATPRTQTFGSPEEPRRARPSGAPEEPHRTQSFGSPDVRRPGARPMQAPDDRPTPTGPSDLHAEMHERFDLGDFTGALSLAESILAEHPRDSDALRIAEVCRTKLRAIYAGRLGALNQIPVVAVPHSELRWLTLDHRAGFVLSLVDGESSLEEIIDVASMPVLEVLRTLYNLTTQRVIELRPPRRR